MVHRFGEEFRRADESYVSALSLMAPVFELPLSDVVVVDGEKAVLECRVAATPAAEVTFRSAFVRLYSASKQQRDKPVVPPLPSVMGWDPRLILT